MKRSVGVSFIASIILTGCFSNTAMPNKINGKYFMAGDPRCYYTKTHPDNDSRITCLDKNQKVTEDRLAMTEQDMMMYQGKMADRRASTQHNGAFGSKAIGGLIGN